MKIYQSIDHLVLPKIAEDYPSLLNLNLKNTKSSSNIGNFRDERDFQTNCDKIKVRNLKNHDLSMREYTRQMVQNTIAVNMMQNQLNSKSIEIDVVTQEYALRKMQLQETE